MYIAHAGAQGCNMQYISTQICTYKLCEIRVGWLVGWLAHKLVTPTRARTITNNGTLSWIAKDAAEIEQKQYN